MKQQIIEKVIKDGLNRGYCLLLRCRIIADLTELDFVLVKQIHYSVSDLFWKYNFTKGRINKAVIDYSKITAILLCGLIKLKG